MMLRRHLAELGIEMTEDEEALLTTGVGANSVLACFTIIIKSPACQE